MLGKIVEIYPEFVAITLLDQSARIRIGDWVEFSDSSVFGKVTVVEKKSCQIGVTHEIEKLKLGQIANLDALIKNVNINLFGNIWGESNSNLNLLDINFGTKNLELTGQAKYDFIPVVRSGESVRKNQKLGYFELQQKLKYWILSPSDQSNYEVKKINSGSFGSGDIVVGLENQDKEYDLGISQQFHLTSRIITIQGEAVIENESQEYDFVVSALEFLDDQIDYTDQKRITFLVSSTENQRPIIQKAYNVALFLTYCGYRILFVNELNDLIINETQFNFGTTINFEGEEGSLTKFDLQTKQQN